MRFSVSSDTIPPQSHFFSSLIHMKKILFIKFAFLGYAMFGLSFGYYTFWLVGADVPWTVNAHPLLPLTQNPVWALLLDAVLICLFLVPHSVMARPGFKKWWTQYVPVPLERSVYVWYSNLSLLLMIGLWQPVTAALWSIQGPVALAIYAVYALGALIIIAATFCIDHFELFGVKQVLAEEQPQPSFDVRFLYKMVRHPIALGHLIMAWAVPVMSVSHFLFTVLATVYVILVTYKYEEKDLVDALGQDYVEYQKTTPGIFPIKFKKS